MTATESSMLGVMSARKRWCGQGSRWSVLFIVIGLHVRFKLILRRPEAILSKARNKQSVNNNIETTTGDQYEELLRHHRRLGQVVDDSLASGG